MRVPPGKRNSVLLERGILSPWTGEEGQWRLAAISPSPSFMDIMFDEGLQALKTHMTDYRGKLLLGDFNARNPA